MVMDYYNQIRADAEQVYANHVLYSSGEDRWLLRRQRDDGSYTSEFSTEIVALYNSSLYVGGDIDVVVFSYGPKDVQSRLRWLIDAGPGYLSQKASIGMGGRDLVMEYNEEIALRELRDLLKEEHWSDDERFWLEGCIENVSDQQYVEHNLPHEAWELLDTLGMVTQRKVFYAQAALARLCELLDVQA